MNTHQTPWTLVFRGTLSRTKVPGPASGGGSYRVRVGAIVGEEPAPLGEAQPGGPRIGEAGQRAGPLGTAGDNLRCSSSGLSDGSKQRAKGSRRAARSLGARCLKTALGPAMKWRLTPFLRSRGTHTQTLHPWGGHRGNSETDLSVRARARLPTGKVSSHAAGRLQIGARPIQ
ncbi:hypothetical protein MRX96_029792 [Rhipicephalus microplus]